jgi:hypothetical protein
MIAAMSRKGTIYDGRMVNKDVVGRRAKKD